MQKTLGGDRLGAGKKMKVDLHNYSRSTHNRGYIFRSTMSSGTLVPFLNEVALPGDTFDINLDCDVKTHPTVGPLFGSFKVQLDVFQCPIRLYNGQLHNNKLGIGLKMSTVKLPMLKLKAPVVLPTDLPDIIDVDNCQINPSSILAYLGIRGIGIADAVAGDNNREFNGVPLLAYWDIYKNYYANKQEEKGAVIHTTPIDGKQSVTTILINTNSLTTPQPLTAGTIINVNFTDPLQGLGNVLILLDNGLEVPVNELGTVIGGTISVTNLQYNWTRYGNRTAISWRYATETDLAMQRIKVLLFELADIDDMREAILTQTTATGAFDIFGTSLDPYVRLVEEDGKARAIMSSQEGLAVKTYQSDMLNNWLSTEWIDGTGGISEVTAIDTSGGSFTIDTLNLSKKVYDMLNRIAVSGGSYDDWLDSVYTENRHTRAESPMYMGGLIKELVFQEVVSVSEAPGSEAGGVQPLGTLAGKGILAKKHKGGTVTIKVEEPSYIMGIISLTPRLDYSQGNTWDVNLKTMDDLHKPALDEIGFQELITEQMAWWDTQQDSTGAWIQKSAGKQPAWLNYMTNINRVRGNFAINSNEMFMTLTRRYEPEIDGGGTGFQIKDLTTYIDPEKFNNIFAQTSLDSQNFWTQIAVDITYRGKISAKLMPNL
ncbi:MAG: major capsid protein [Microviridae sp.]|nr:MAG: major capsid protein [Microviridae sp.]